MKPEFEDSLPPLTEEEIQLVEKMASITFPKEYRNFLKTINGGFIDPADFKAEGWFIQIAYFFGVSLNDPNTLTESQKMVNLFSLEKKEKGPSKFHFASYKNYNIEYCTFPHNTVEGLPTNLFIIGVDSCDDFTLISLEGEDRGQIYQYEHDNPEHWDENYNFIYESLSGPISSFDVLLNSATLEYQDYDDD